MLYYNVKTYFCLVRHCHYGFLNLGLRFMIRFNPDKKIIFVVLVEDMVGLRHRIWKSRLIRDPDIY